MAPPTAVPEAVAQSFWSQCINIKSSPKLGQPQPVEILGCPNGMSADPKWHTVKIRVCDWERKLVEQWQMQDGYVLTGSRNEKAENLKFRALFRKGLGWNPDSASFPAVSSAPTVGNEDGQMAQMSALVLKLEKKLRMQKHKTVALNKTINKFEMLPRVTEPGPRSIKLSPPATGKKTGELTDWADLEEDYKCNLRQSIIFPSLRRVLNCVGGLKAMDAELAHLFCTHSFCDRSQSVTDDQCLFYSGVNIARLSGAVAREAEAARERMKWSISPYKLMVFLDEKGVAQSIPRGLRQIYDGLIHSERQIGYEKDNERVMAARLLGVPIEIFDGNNARLGYMLDTIRCVKQLAIRAMVSELQPIDEEEVDFEAMADSEREDYQAQLCEMREKEGNAKGNAHFVKVEASLKNVEKKFKAGKKRCQALQLQLQLKPTHTYPGDVQFR